MKSIPKAFVLLGLIVSISMPILSMEDNVANQCPQVRTPDPRNSEIELDAECLLHNRIKELEKYIKEHNQTLPQSSISRANDALQAARFSIKRALTQTNPQSSTISLICARRRIMAAEKILGIEPIAEHIKLF